MRLASTDLPGLYAQMSAYTPALEVVAIQTPDFAPGGGTITIPAEDSPAGVHAFAFIADSSPDTKATIQVKVEVLNGDNQGKLSTGWIDPTGQTLVFDVANADGSGLVSVTAIPPASN